MADNLPWNDPEVRSRVFRVFASASKADSEDDELITEVIKAASQPPANVLRGLRAMVEFGAPHVITPIASTGPGDIVDDARAALAWLDAQEK